MTAFGVGNQPGKAIIGFGYIITKGQNGGG